MKKKIWDVYAPVYERAMKADQKIYEFMVQRIPGQIRAKEELIRTLDEWNSPRSIFCFEGLPCDCFCIEKTGSGASQK